MRTSSPLTSSKRKPASDSRSRSSAVQRTGSAHVAIVDDVMLPSFDITHSADNIIVQRATNRQEGAGVSPPWVLAACRINICVRRKPDVVITLASIR